MELNAKLQKKKNELRTELAEKGFFKKSGTNEFDKYSYFTEAQYKDLFNKMFSKHSLELTSSVIDVIEFTGTQKMPFGRRVKVEFTLHDTETGFSENSIAFGEGNDKGDKALYKALTGALKYYYANTFTIPTGDDAEKETGDGIPAFATEDDIAIIESVYKKHGKFDELLLKNNINDIRKMPYDTAVEIVKKLREKAKEED